MAISGKPGLFRVVSNVGQSVIVQSLLDGKRIPVQAAHRVSSLQDISIYTYDADVALGEVFDMIKAKEGDGLAIDHKSSAAELRDYMGGIMPKFDEDRVYPSDLKKLFQWYNLLHKHDLLIADSEESAIEDAVEITDAPEEAAKASTEEATDAPEGDKA